MAEAAARVGEQGVDRHPSDPDRVVEFLYALASGQVGLHGFDLRAVPTQLVRGHLDCRFVSRYDQIVPLLCRVPGEFQADALKRRR